MGKTQITPDAYSHLINTCMVKREEALPENQVNDRLGLLYRTACQQRRTKASPYTRMSQDRILKTLNTILLQR